jgi:hypothetical protein
LAKLDLVKEKTILNYKKELQNMRNNFAKEEISTSKGIQQTLREKEVELKNNNERLNRDLINQIFQARRFEDLGRTFVI